jgi:hypothetical protein
MPVETAARRLLFQSAPQCFGLRNPSFSLRDLFKRPSPALPSSYELDLPSRQHPQISAWKWRRKSVTLRWREMDSNYWSRHGETPLGRAMWFPRTAPPVRRGTDPERDEKFESGFLHQRVRCSHARIRSPCWRSTLFLPPLGRDKLAQAVVGAMQGARDVLVVGDDVTAEYFDLRRFLDASGGPPLDRELLRRRRPEGNDLARTAFTSVTVDSDRIRKLVKRMLDGSVTPMQSNALAARLPSVEPRTNVRELHHSVAEAKVGSHAGVLEVVDLTIFAFR